MPSLTEIPLSGSTSEDEDSRWQHLKMTHNKYLQDCEVLQNRGGGAFLYLIWLSHFIKETLLVDSTT